MRDAIIPSQASVSSWADNREFVGGDLVSYNGVMRCPGLSQPLLVLCILLGAATLRGQPATSPAYPESTDGLRQFFTDLLVHAEERDGDRVLSMTRSLVLEDAASFFKQTFGESRGKTLAEEYATETKGFAQSRARLFMAFRKPRDLTITVTCVESLDDPNAKAYQRLAMDAMENPIPLYTAQFKGGAQSRTNFEMWSFAYVDGHFKFLGKMTVARH